MREVSWNEGAWLNPPADVEYRGSEMIVTAIKESDFWRNTSYGFVHDSAHALLIDFPDKSAIEVSYVLDFDQMWDQAGLIVFADDEHWTKAGIEHADGALQIGAVVTNFNSDWSTAPINEWLGHEVSFRASRDGNAVTIRGKCDALGVPWRLVRLFPINPDFAWKAGPHVAAPSRAGLKVRFTRFVVDVADETLH
jgi:regulation of enolase protein 1 (concanavalin A-like superfamily)